MVKLNKLNNLSKIVYHIRSFVEFFVPHSPVSSSNTSSIIFLTPFGVKYDGRVIKSINALLANGYTVELIKPEDLIDDEIATWHPKLTITPLGLSGSYSHFPYIYDWRVANYIRKSSAIHIVCRDLFTGVMGIRAGHASGKHVTIDFYEWYSEAKDYDFKNKCTYPKSAWKKALFRYYERYICLYANRLITNNRSFAAGIAQGVVPIEKFNIVRNMPDEATSQQHNSVSLRNWIPENLHKHKILYYVGQLSFDRKLDTIIDGMQYLHDCVLLMQGSGHTVMQDHYKYLLNQKNIKERVFFLPPLHHSHIVNYAQSSDIGVFICDTQDNKMFNALPNKLFEYVWAGIPQVSSHGSEIDSIFNENKIGQLFDAYEPKSFANAVKLLMDEETYKKQKKNVETYRNKLISQNDWSYFTLHSCGSANTPSSD